MDVPRPGRVLAKRIHQAIYIALALMALISITAVLSQLDPAVPVIDKVNIYSGKVKRGSMTRQVIGTGRLVPEVLRWIAARMSGQVERVLLQPGAFVSPETIVLELANPELEQQVFEAARQLKQAEAELTSLRIQLEREFINQEADAARTEAEYLLAKLQAESDRELTENGLVSGLVARTSEARFRALANLHKLEQRRLKIFSEGINAQLEAKQAEVEQRGAFRQLRLRQLASLKVRADIEGVLQEVQVEVGEQVSPGTKLARVAEPSRLKARIGIPATQARDIQIGQKVSVDTHNGMIAGSVSRLEPVVQDGLVTVDVELRGCLPRGARPDLPVDGTIELEHLADIVYVRRPAFGQENSTISIFRIDAHGTYADRVQVKLGRASVSQMEVLQGLRPGDEVILSDLPQWDEYDRIRLR